MLDSTIRRPILHPNTGHLFEGFEVTCRIRRTSSFTLIEILAVIVIMGIVAALLVMAAKGARQRADLDAAKANIAFIAGKIDAYKAKRGQLPPNLNPGAGPGMDSYTTEQEIYQTLAEWGLTVPPEKQLDPWRQPFIIVFQRDYGVSFPIDGSLAPYNVRPWNKIGLMYVNGGPSPKEIHEGDPLTTRPYLGETDSYQIISAGPDGLLSRDDGERTGDPDGDGRSVNADNLTNW